MLTEEALLGRIAALEAALEKARSEAVTDELTGCLNRRGWHKALAREQARCTRHDMDAVVAVIDLNKFKDVNDRDGHHAGDELLCRCAKTLAAATRACDYVGRVGGDEFAVLAVQTLPGETDRLQGRIEVALAGADIDATVGCAALSQCDSLEEAWQLADQAMLARKTA